MKPPTDEQKQLARVVWDSLTYQERKAIITVIMYIALQELADDRTVIS